MTPLRHLPRKPVLLCALVAVVGAAVFIALASREPRFKGRAFSYWVDQLPAKLVWTNVPISVLNRRSYQEFLVTSDDADRAIDTLGPACLGTLVLRLRARENTTTRLSYALKSEAVRLGIFKPDWRLGAAWFKRGQAIYAFSRLGARAKPALPQILALARCMDDPGVRRDALEVLRRVSPADYPNLAEQDAAKAGPR